MSHRSLKSYLSPLEFAHNISFPRPVSMKFSKLNLQYTSKSVTRCYQVRRLSFTPTLKNDHKDSSENKSGHKHLKVSNYVSRQLHVLEDIARTVSKKTQYDGSFTPEYLMKPHKGLSHLKSLLSDSLLEKLNFSDINYNIPTIIRNIFFKGSADDIHQKSYINVWPIIAPLDEKLKDGLEKLLPIDALINMKMFIHNSVEGEELKRNICLSKSTASIDTSYKEDGSKVNNNLVQKGIKRSTEKPVSDEEIIKFISSKVGKIDPEFRKNYRFDAEPFIDIISGLFNRFDQRIYMLQEKQWTKDIYDVCDFRQQVEDKVDSLFNLWNYKILEKIYDSKHWYLRDLYYPECIRLPRTFHTKEKLSQIEIDYSNRFNQLQRITQKHLKTNVSISASYITDTESENQTTKLPVVVKRPRLNDLDHDKIDDMIHQVVEQSLFSLSKFGYLTDSISYFAMVEIMGYDAESKKVEVSVKSIPFVKDDIDELGDSILTPEALMTYGLFKNMDAVLSNDQFVLALLIDILPQTRAEEREIISNAYQRLIDPSEARNIFFPEHLMDRYETNYVSGDIADQTLTFNSEEFREILKDERNKHIFDWGAISDKFGVNFQVQITMADRLYKVLNPDEYHLDEDEAEEEDEEDDLSSCWLFAGEEDPITRSERLLERRAKMLGMNKELNDPLVTSGLLCLRSSLDDTIFGAGFGIIEIKASEESKKTIYEGLMESDELFHSYLDQLLAMNELGFGYLRDRTTPEIINGKVYLNFGWLVYAYNDETLVAQRKELMDIKNGLKKLDSEYLWNKYD